MEQMPRFEIEQPTGDDFPTDITDKLPHYEEGGEPTPADLFGYDFVSEQERETVLRDSYDALMEGRMVDVDYRFFAQLSQSSKDEFSPILREIKHRESDEGYYSRIGKKLIYQEELPDLTKYQAVNLIRNWEHFSNYPEDYIITFILDCKSFSDQEKRYFIKEKFSRFEENFSLYIGRIDRLLDILGEDEDLVALLNNVDVITMITMIITSGEGTIDRLESLMGKSTIHDKFMSTQNILAISNLQQIQSNYSIMNRYVSQEELDRLVDKSISTGPTRSLEGIKEMLVFSANTPEHRKEIVERLVVFLQLSSIDYTNRGGIEDLLIIQQTVAKLAETFEIDDPMFRKLLLLIPKSGHSNLIHDIREEALAIERVDYARLEVVHQMIHNFPGPQNIEVMEALRAFLNEESGPDLFNELISQIGRTNWPKINKGDLEQLKPALKQVTETIVELKSLYLPSDKQFDKLAKDWSEMVNLPDIEAKLKVLADQIFRGPNENGTKNIQYILDFRRELQSLSKDMVTNTEKIESIYFDVRLEQMTFTLFAQEIQMIEDNPDDNIEKMIELAQLGIAISKLDGFWTTEMNALFARISEVSSVYQAGTITEERYMSELGTAFEKYSDKSESVINNLSTLIKSDVIAQLEQNDVAEDRIEIETEQAVSGFYRGTVFNLTNNLMPYLLTRLPRAKRMSIADIRNL